MRDRWRDKFIQNWKNLKICELGRLYMPGPKSEPDVWEFEYYLDAMFYRALLAS